MELCWEIREVAGLDLVGMVIDLEEVAEVAISGCHSMLHQVEIMEEV